jgi:hypothetical protein
MTRPTGWTVRLLACARRGGHAGGVWSLDDVVLRSPMEIGDTYRGWMMADHPSELKENIPYSRRTTATAVGSIER